MKILYGIQGTGNGHISRAREVVPYLQKYGDVDLLISGTEADVTLPYMIKYKRHGFSFVFGQNGGPAVWDTIKKFKPIRLMRDMAQFPVHDYDLVISDFEPISAWASYLRKKHCVAFSHQAAFLSPKTPRPDKKNFIIEKTFKWYAPTQTHVGLHFDEYDSFVKKPIIRAGIRNLEATDKGHVTVYLPAYGDETLINNFKKVKEVEWHVFSKHSKQEYKVENVIICPIVNDGFNASMAAATGVISGGGFETPAEALYLQKKLMIIPMLGNYEQACNALAAKKLGVMVVPEIGPDFVEEIKQWLEFKKTIIIDYPNHAEHTIHDLVMANTNKAVIDRQLRKFSQTVKVKA